MKRTEFVLNFTTEFAPAVSTLYLEAIFPSLGLNFLFY